jgi:hypothetical protein
MSETEKEFLEKLESEKLKLKEALGDGHDYDRCYCCRLTELKLNFLITALHKNMEFLNEKINRLSRE